MTTPTRTAVLNDNRERREGNGQKPRAMDWGEVEFRIPEADFPVLCKMYPGLDSTDHDELEAAWKTFRHSPIAEQYFVKRTPRKVQRSIRHGNAGIIIK